MGDRSYEIHDKGDGTAYVECTVCKWRMGYPTDYIDRSEIVNLAESTHKGFIVGTGIKDINGKEISDGDWLRSNKDWRGNEQRNIYAYVDWDELYHKRWDSRIVTNGKLNDDGTLSTMDDLGYHTNVRNDLEMTVEEFSFEIVEKPKNLECVYSWEDKCAVIRRYRGVNTRERGRQ